MFCYQSQLLLHTLQIKAVDNGIPQKWSTVQLRVEWIRKPLPFPKALQFMVSSYNFVIAENAKVFENVGTIFVRQTETPLWFEITGELQHGWNWIWFHVSMVCCMVTYWYILQSWYFREKKFSFVENVTWFYSPFALPCFFFLMTSCFYVCLHWLLLLSLWLHLEGGTSQEMFYIPQMYHANCTGERKNSCYFIYILNFLILDELYNFWYLLLSLSLLWAKTQPLLE